MKGLNHSIVIPNKKIEAVCQRHQIKRLALFGSALREDFNSSSDIDILILFKPEAKIGFMKLGKIQRELSKIFDRPVDLVPQEGLKKVIKKEIITHALEIYAA